MAGKREAKQKKDGAEEKKEEPLTLGQSLYSWLQAVAPVIIGIVLIFTFVGRLTPVSGDSMLPTLRDKDMMVVRHLGYTPAQGDVVVLTKYFDNVTGPIVKRVIAVAGQTVEIDYGAGTVTVDGEPLSEDYTLEPMEQQSWQTITSITVPEGEVFVMGDNRNVSNDSRNPDLGSVDVRYILGKAEFVLLPFHSVGAIV